MFSIKSLFFSKDKDVMTTRIKYEDHTLYVLLRKPISISNKVINDAPATIICASMDESKISQLYEPTTDSMLSMPCVEEPGPTLFTACCTLNDEVIMHYHKTFFDAEFNQLSAEDRYNWIVNEVPIQAHVTPLRLEALM